MTTIARDEEELRARFGTLAVPAGLTERVLRTVRARAAEVAATPAFDIVATPAGVAHVRVGRGRTEAPTARARDWAARAREEIAEYLAGLRSYFGVPLDLSAVPAFQRAVLASAATIPFGEVRPYRWVAERIGRPAAVRAVGTALGTNPVAPLLPCHRVVRSDGTLGGYIYGLPLKERLLRLERETPALVGCSTTRILCRRGCMHEQRMGEERRIVFASLAEARSVGYRPCTRCRPAA
jgi:O-6-methylguanine DNA methyltransferase